MANRSCDQQKIIGAHQAQTIALETKLKITYPAGMAAAAAAAAG